MKDWLTVLKCSFILIAELSLYIYYQLFQPVLDRISRITVQVLFDLCQEYERYWILAAYLVHKQPKLPAFYYLSINEKIYRLNAWARLKMI